MTRKHVIDDDTTSELLDALKQSPATAAVLKAVTRAVFKVKPGDQIELVGKLELTLKAAPTEKVAKEAKEDEDGGG